MPSSNSKEAIQLPAYLYPKEDHRPQQNQRVEKSKLIITGIYYKVGYQTQHILHNLIHNISQYILTPILINQSKLNKYENNSLCNATRLMKLHAYACGTNSTFSSSYEPGSNLYEPRAPSLNLGQATSLLSELAYMSLDTTLMMHAHIIKSIR